MAVKSITRQVGPFKMKIMKKGGGINKTLRGIGKKKRREPELLFLLEKEIKSLEGKHVLVDVGANIGYVSLHMASWMNKNGKIFCIEPDPRNFELLIQNMKINGFDKVSFSEEMAMANHTGEIEFYMGSNASNLGSLYKHKKSVDKPIKVKCDTMTNYFKEKKVFPNLIKMDLEGGEVQVMEGMFQLVKENNFPCKIIMELHPQFYPKKKGLEYWMNGYFKLGFKPKIIISAAGPQPDKFKEWGYEPFKIIRGKGFYNTFSNEHAIIASCRVNKQLMPGKGRYSPKIARYIFIERK